MHSYSADLLALRQRAGPSSAYNFLAVKQHVAAAADRVFCVVGGPGEGKSTLAAMMLESGGDATGFIHASHFCKRADTNRQVTCLAPSPILPTHTRLLVYSGCELDIGLWILQDIIGICRSLAYQIAQHYDHSDEFMFGLTDQEAETVQTDPTVAVEKLIVRQLHGLAASGRRVVILLDALDEAQERGTNRVVRLLRDLGKAQTNCLSVVVTMVGNKSHDLFIHPPLIHQSILIAL